MPGQEQRSERNENDRRRVVQHGRASTTSSIAHAVVLKSDELFFLCDPNGDVPLDDASGLGLYYHDCRYLSGYELRIGGARADSLATLSGAGASATFELTNRDLQTAGAGLLEKESVGVKWERTLDADECALHDTIAFSNFGVARLELPVIIRLRCGFESLFAVRGAQPKHRGNAMLPRWEDATLHFEYEGADKVRRALTAAFEPAPQAKGDATATFRFAIEPNTTTTLHLSLHVGESPIEQGKQPAAKRAAHDEHIERTRRAEDTASKDWVAEATRVSSDDLRLDGVIERSLRDLRMLATPLRGHRYFAAGVPWYVTLFGRDAIISALETLAFLPDRAEDTVRLLASFQGTREDAWRDEEPGKIMHELRVGEMARMGEIPQTPYYGTVDATPLFLILLARHAQWTGRLDLFQEFEATVQAALGWIDRSIAQGGMDYLAYATKSQSGLSNQGWKDSGDSIVNGDGTLAAPPIALVEVQGYVYMAKHAIGSMYGRIGNTAAAERLAREADALRQRFQRDFWIEELGTYALALQAGKRPAAVVASNAGHALWTGIAQPEFARATAERLMQDDMFSGWGIRTLSCRERRYNPIAYHDGTVWPHDNAIAVAGFRRWGCVDAIARVLAGIVDAASHFEHHRLPEVFAGFSRGEFASPVRYPVACHPQAWAAGAVPFMMESALGLLPDGFDKRLRISHPVLPESVRDLSLTNLRVAGASVDLRFRRDDRGEVTVEVVRCDGGLDVTTDAPA
jgi:glycogen debranching enzyme